ncbi:MAG TPA: GNAT family N-acetyltransferase [Candidatus Elarobacter sp.]|nr:GNAT family N-acetyltransferase [Candidatus Elarobacter sp.]
MRTTWSVRPKGERDVDTVVSLLAEIAREGRWIATEWPFDVEARARSMRDALLRRWCVGWVAVDEREIVADLTIFDIDAAEPELGMLVAASHRRRGIGRALLDEAVAWARANGKAALTLRVFPDNVAARTLYASAGFVDKLVQHAAIARRDGAPLDAIVMRRPVADG